MASSKRQVVSILRYAALSLVIAFTAIGCALTADKAKLIVINQTGVSIIEFRLKVQAGGDYGGNLIDAAIPPSESLQIEDLIPFETYMLFVRFEDGAVSELGDVSIREAGTYTVEIVDT